MKKVGKLLIGVLSVGALIGTGYAAWTVNGGYVSNDGEIPFEIATIGSKEMSLEVTEKDTNEKVVFDAPKEWHGNEHLSKTYNVKAIKGVDLVDTPYVCATNGYWELVSKPYQPHLKISTVAIDKETKEALTGARLTKLESYITLPKDEVVDYKTWLKSELETTGFEYTFTFSWTSGYNPQIAWKDLAAEEQTKNFTDLNKAFDGVAFKYTIQVGGVNEDTPIKKTSFTYTENDLVAIDFTLEDMTKVMPGDLLDVGTEVFFDLLVEDGYTYETYFNGTLLEDISFVLVEGTNNFEVRLTKEEPPVKTYKVNVTGEHITFNYSTDITKELPLGTEVTFTYTVEEGYELKSLTFNGVDVKETKKFTVVADKNELVATTELIPVAKKAKVIVDATLTGAEIAITGETEDKMYELGTTITLTASGSVGYELQELYYTVEGSETKVAITDNTFTVTEEKTYTIGYTVLDLSNPIKATIAEVIADTTYDQTHLYEVTGTVTSIERAEYGRFSMTDDSGKTIKIYGSRIENAENKSLSYVNGKYDYSYSKGDDPTPAMQVGYRVTVLAFGKKSGSYNNYYGVISSYEVVAIAPTAITIDSEMTMQLGGSDRKVTATTTPSTINVNLTWNSSNKEVATISEDGTIHALAIGTTEITASYNEVVSNKLILTVEIAADYTLVGEYNFEPETYGKTDTNPGTISNSIYNKDITKDTPLNTVLAISESANNSGVITGFTSPVKAYTTSKVGCSGFKIGTKDPGSIIFNANQEINKVEIMSYAWKGETCNLTINGVTLAVDKNTSGITQSKLLSFEFNATNTIEIKTSRRCVIVGIKLYK